MAKIPGPRKPGQTGGGGRLGHLGSRGLSGDRGGRPHAGGGGTGRKPPKKGCAVLALAMVSVPVGALAALGYAAWEVFS